MPRAEARGSLLTLERIAPLLGIPHLSASGPVSMSGQVQGKTGNAKDLLASLHGRLENQMGPGKISRIGRGGEMIARLISLTSWRGILTGSVFENFAKNGLPYQRISVQANFQNGNMDVNNFQFESNAMNVSAQGRINLLEEQMDVRASLKPLSMLSTAIGFVPLVGKVAASLTEIQFTVSGPWMDPRVSIIPGQGIADSIQDQARGVGSRLGGVADLFAREESKWIRK
jgi:uncharacterized protein YhdP